MHAKDELTSPILPQPITPTPRGSSAILKDDADLRAAPAIGTRFKEAWGTTNAELHVAIKATIAADCIMVGFCFAAKKGIPDSKQYLSRVAECE